jgi:hypothetical protein
MRRSGWFSVFATALWTGLVPGCHYFGVGNQSAGPENRSKLQAERDPDMLPPQRFAEKGPDSVQPPQKIDVLLPNGPPPILQPQEMPLPPIVEDRGPPVVQAQPVVQKSEPPPKPDPEVVLALRKLLDHKPTEAKELLHRYGPTNEESLWRLLNIADRFHEKGLNGLSPNELCTIQTSLQALDRVVRSKAPLHIDNMFFFESRGPGEVRPLKAGHVFRAGHRDRPGELVQVHVEFHNLLCQEPHDGKMYQNIILCTAEISDSADKSGRPLWKADLDKGKVTLRSPAPRTDYATNYTFYLPPLPSGNLVLSITVQDLTDPEQVRVARRSLEFCVNNMSENVAASP